MLRKVPPNGTYHGSTMVATTIVLASSAVLKIKKDTWKVELFPWLTLIHSRG